MICSAECSVVYFIYLLKNLNSISMLQNLLYMIYSLACVISHFWWKKICQLLLKHVIYQIALPFMFSEIQIPKTEIWKLSFPLPVFQYLFLIDVFFFSIRMIALSGCIRVALGSCRNPRSAPGFPFYSIPFNICILVQCNNYRTKRWFPYSLKTHSIYV